MKCFQRDANLEHSHKVLLPRAWPSGPKVINASRGKDSPGRSCCISFTSDSPYKSLWGGGEEERGKSFCVLGYHSCCCRCKETLAAQGPPDVDGGTEHSARATRRGRTLKCSTNAVSERTGDAPNSADSPPRHRVKSTFLQNGNHTPDSSWMGRKENTAHRVRKLFLS